MLPEPEYVRIVLVFGGFPILPTLSFLSTNRGWGGWGGAYLIAAPYVVNKNTPGGKSDHKGMCVHMPL